MSRVGETMTYPDAPGFRVSGPSEQAAEAIAGTASKMREMVLAQFALHPSGATADEIAKDLNLSVLSVRPRVSELKRTGKIVQTKSRRKNESGMTATVWRIASQLPSGVANQSSRPTEPETSA
jgi:predicted ArsR family transcriptional regulator